MKRIITALSLISVLAFAGPSLAEERVDHMKQAREHLNAAVKQGQMDNTNALVEHAQTALEHLRMAQRQRSSSDLDRAAKSLQETISEGRAGNNHIATEHARESVEYIDAATGSLGG